MKSLTQINIGNEYFYYVIALLLNIACLVSENGRNIILIILWSFVLFVGLKTFYFIIKMDKKEYKELTKKLVHDETTKRRYTVLSICFLIVANYSALKDEILICFISLMLGVFNILSYIKLAIMKKENV